MTHQTRRPKPAPAATAFVLALAEQMTADFLPVIAAVWPPQYHGPRMTDYARVAAAAWASGLHADRDGWAAFPNRPLAGWLRLNEFAVSTIVGHLKNDGLIALRPGPNGRPLNPRQARYVGPCPLAGR